MKIETLNKGELGYCNMEVLYTKNNKEYKKKLNQMIFSRNYDDNIFPILNVVNYKRFINKWDKKNNHLITKLEIVSLQIITRTGYKHKPDQWK